MLQFRLRAIQMSDFPADVKEAVSEFPGLIGEHGRKVS